MKRLPIVEMEDLFDPAAEVLWRMGVPFMIFVQVQVPADRALQIAQDRGEDDALMVLEARLGRWDAEQTLWVEQREVGLTSRTALLRLRDISGLGWKIGRLPCGPIEHSGRIA